MFEVINAENPRFVESDQSVIVLNVQFSHLPAPVEFAASMHDIEVHGREIYVRALAGEFGLVAEYVPPTPAEIAATMKATRMNKAIQKVQHYEMMGNTDMVTQWKTYYADVYNGVIYPVEPVEL